MESPAKLLALLLVLVSYALPAHAVPAFNRQTGQNCVACHAGGNYPDLTPYGRLFKLTGYTIGTRSVPLAAMAIGSYTKTSNTQSADPQFDPAANFPKDGQLIFQTASLFIAGKVTDNVGLFAQYTYNNYDQQNANSHWVGHSMSDNFDLRYADRFIQPGSDLIFGATLNNNPTVTDVWNSSPGWGYNVVPGSAGPATTPLIAGGLAQSVAGGTAYVYWKRTLYAEVGTYRTADGFWSFLSHGLTADRGDMTFVKSGANPYWRVALTHDWGPHSAMIGAMGLNAKVYPDPTAPSGPTNDFRDVAVDGQYQFILDPHALTLTALYAHEHVSYASSVAGQPPPLDPDGSLGMPLTNASDTLNMFRAKATYVYDARYGGSASFFNVSGSTNSALQTSATDPANPGQPLDGSQGVVGNATGNPATRGWTLEAFWLPVQYARVGVQYTWFNKFNGASTNYDAFGRNASANNSLFVYLWLAY